jgi:ABC-type bacteriocin/lantibiotic exporter with double-glycine peptidase domain
MLIGSILEMLGLGLIVPLLASITDFENINQYTKYLNFLFNLQDKNYTDFILTICSLIAFVYLIKNSILIFISYFQLNFVKKFNNKLGYDLFKKYISNEYSYFLGRNSSSFIRSLSTDLNLLSSSIINYTLICLESLILTSVLILLFLYNLKITLVILLIFSLFILIYFKISKKKIKDWANNRLSAENTKVKILKESLTFIREIKIYKLVNYFSNIFDTSNKKLSSTMFKHVFLQSTVRLLLEMLTILIVLIGIVFLAYNANINSIVPTIGLYVAAAFKLIPSLNRIITSYQAIRFVNPVLKNYLNELQNNSYKDEETNLLKEEKFKHQILLRNIHFAYNNRDPIFENINLKIIKGTFTVIIGKSGIGKSSFLDLLAGFLYPTKGEIIIDNEYDIKSKIFDWHQKIAYNPQNNIILNSTLIDNITIGESLGNIDQKKLEFAIDIAGLNGLIETLPDGIYTELGETGNNLSGGQKQRVGIARTIYKDKKILLFDEATNALDKDTNDIILKNIKEYCRNKNKTVIFISHDKYVLDHADHIIDLDILTKKK